MFDLRGHANPRMFAVVVNRNRRRGKTRFRKRAHGHGDKILSTFETPINGGTALWTEVENDSVAFIAVPDIFLRLAFDLDGLGTKARLSSKHASGAPLTLQTVADGYSDRLFAHRDRDLTTATRRDSRWHDDSISRLL